MVSIAQQFGIMAMAAGTMIGSPADATEITPETCSDPTFVDQVRLHNAPDEVLADAMFPEMFGHIENLNAEDAAFSIGMLQTMSGVDAQEAGDLEAMLDDGVVTPEEHLSINAIILPHDGSEISERAQNITELMFDRAGINTDITYKDVSVFDSIAARVDGNIEEYATADYFMNHSRLDCDQAGQEASMEQQQDRTMDFATL